MPVMCLLSVANRDDVKEATTSSLPHLLLQLVVAAHLRSRRKRLPLFFCSLVFPSSSPTLHHDSLYPKQPIQWRNDSTFWSARSWLAPVSSRRVAREREIDLLSQKKRTNARCPKKRRYFNRVFASFFFYVERRRARFLLLICVSWFLELERMSMRPLRRGADASIHSIRPFPE